MRSVPKYGSALFHNGVNSGAVLLAMAPHLVEIALWALTFFLTAEYRSFYHSAMNYTTPGGNVIMSPQ